MANAERIMTADKPSYYYLSGDKACYTRELRHFLNPINYYDRLIKNRMEKKKAKEQSKKYESGWFYKFMDKKALQWLHGFELF